MNTIDDFFHNIDKILELNKFRNCSYPVFRGHSKSTYILLPTLHRVCRDKVKDVWELENNLYCDFRSLVGSKIKFDSCWDTLFAMRHEGIPTRLLDWTESLGTALFFALNSTDLDGPHVWILNPYAMNENNPDIKGGLVNPQEDLENYSKTYPIYDKNNSELKIHDLPIALYPNRSNDRLLAQRGFFTIHGLNENELERNSSEYLQRIDIPENLVDPLRKLIKTFGINSYSVYPDLKGLSDYLKEIYHY